MLRYLIAYLLGRVNDVPVLQGDREVRVQLWAEGVDGLEGSGGEDECPDLAAGERGQWEACKGPDGFFAYIEKS